MIRHTRSSPPPLRGRSTAEGGREGGKPTAHRPVASVIRGRAKSLRRDMTDAERCLWSALRAHRLDGMSFRRQTPIGRYIVDFACHERRLVIEVDGGQHSRATRDIERDRWLESKGYRVLRFWNSDVLKNRVGVLQAIVDAASSATPLPSPPPQGGREQAAASGGDK
ncbi:MAG TPA: endonuclease domain-containing protein [Pseudolabrys sp.]|nr:endonuclease domain-containing protein [Pseudolabrys sp.]